MRRLEEGVDASRSASGGWAVGTIARTMDLRLGRRGGVVWFELARAFCDQAQWSTLSHYVRYRTLATNAR